MEFSKELRICEYEIIKKQLGQPNCTENKIDISSDSEEDSLVPIRD